MEVRGSSSDWKMMYRPKCIILWYGLTLNHDKCTCSTEVIRLLGYEISNGSISPDPERFAALLNLPAQRNAKEQQRIVVMFAYYSQWFSVFR